MKLRPSTIARAIEIIAAAERDLGPLSDGQRRDLLMDNTTWRRSTIEALVDHAVVAAALYDEPVGGNSRDGAV